MRILKNLGSKTKTILLTMFVGAFIVVVGCSSDDPITDQHQQNFADGRIDLVPVNISFEFSDQFGLTDTIALTSYNIDFQSCTSPAYNPTNITSGIGSLGLGSGSTSCEFRIHEAVITTGQTTRTYGSTTYFANLDDTVNLTDGGHSDTLIAKLVDYELDEGGGVAASDKIVIAFHQRNTESDTLGADTVNTVLAFDGQHAPRVSIPTSGVFLAVEDTTTLVTTPIVGNVDIEIIFECDVTTTGEADDTCAGFDLGATASKVRFFPASEVTNYSQLETKLEAATGPGLIEVDLATGHALQETEAGTVSSLCGQLGTTVTNNGVCIKIDSFANFSFDTDYMACIYQAEAVTEHDGANNYYGAKCTTIDFGEAYTNP